MTDCPFHGGFRHYATHGERHRDGVDESKCICMKAPTGHSPSITNTDAHVNFDAANVYGLRVENSIISGSLSGSTLYRSSIVDTKLRQAELSWVTAPYSILKGVSFQGCDAESADFHGSDMSRCEFSSTSAEKLQLTAASVKDCLFNDVRATWLDTSASHISDSVFVHCGLRKSTHKGTRFVRTHFEKCNFTCSSFELVQFTDCIITEGCLYDAVLIDPHKTNTKFSASSFVNCSLIGADFTHVRLLNVRFHECDMRGANFSNSNIEPTIMTNCDLRNANFAGAVITSVDLTGSNLTGADFTRSTYNSQTRWPDGFVPPPEAHSVTEHAEVGQFMLSVDVKCQQSDICFLAAPPLSSMEFVMQMLPDLFQVVNERWAFPRSPIAGDISRTILLTASQCQAGDGTLPFDSDEERVACVAKHLAGLITPSVLLANVEVHEAAGTVGSFYASLDVQIKKSMTAARRKARKKAAKTTAQREL